MSTERRNLILTISLVLLAALGAGGWFTYRALAAPAIAPARPEPHSLRAAPCAPPLQVLPRSEKPPVSNRAPFVSQRPADLDESSLYFQSASGEPVAGLNLRLESTGGAEDATTAEDGTLRLDERHHTGLTLTLPEGEQRFSRNGREFAQSVQLPNLRRRDVDYRTVTVYFLRTYEVDVQYEDGQAWQGELLFASGGSAPYERMKGENGRVGGLVVADGMEAHATAPTYRASFGTAAARWLGGEADPARPIQITLQKAELKNSCLLLIDLSGFTKSEPVNVTYYESRISSLGVDRRTSLGVTVGKGGETRVLGGHRAGRFEVMASTATHAWASGIFKTEPGETRTLVAMPEPAGTVIANVKTDQGEILADTRMFIRPGLYPLWQSWLRDSPGSCQIGRVCAIDAAGKCELRGVPPGQIEIEIASRRHESFVKIVDVPAGGLVDLGDIILRPAAGVIQIQLSNHDSTRLYEACLYQAGRGQVDEPVPFNDFAFLDMQHVPLRAYLILIRQQGGGHAKQHYVEMTPENPIIKLDVDMSE